MVDRLSLEWMLADVEALLAEEESLGKEWKGAARLSSARSRQRQCEI